MDQINIDALASRRFSGLDLLQSPYDAVSGEDIQRLLAWEDDTLPGWTRMKKSRDYEIFKGTAVDGGPPIIKVGVLSWGERIGAGEGHSMTSLRLEPKTPGD